MLKNEYADFRFHAIIMSADDAFAFSPLRFRRCCVAAILLPLLLPLYASVTPDTVAMLCR